MSSYPPAPKRRPGSGPLRPVGRKPFGATWWGKAWIDALEHRARLDPNRLPRGRTYARTGAVCDVQVHSGEITAAVQGSRTTPYKVTVRVRTYSEKEWDRALAALASEVGRLAALLDGEMPPEVAQDLGGAGIDLLPAAGEVQPRCTCPDWADPCKHSAAVCYLVADALDADPFLLFSLRGRDRDALLAGLRARRADAGAAAGAPGVASEAAPETGGAGLGQGTSGGHDVGIPARQVWARWASVSSDGAPAIPAIPLLPPRPGKPTVLAVDPPPGSGLSSASLLGLAADAAGRAWDLAHGEVISGLELSYDEDLARRAAAALGPGSPQGTMAELAASSGVPARELLDRALAWRDGGREGVFVLLEEWAPSRDALSRARAVLGDGASGRRNRASLGDRQLRVGRDGRLYPFRRAGRSGRAGGSGSWTPDGAPLEGFGTSGSTA